MILSKQNFKINTKNKNQDQSLFVRVVWIVVNAFHKSGHSRAVLSDGGVDVDVVEDFVFGVFAEALDQFLLGF